MDEYIQKQLDGEFPLWHSFWINSICITNIAVIVISLIFGTFIAISGIDIGIGIVFSQLISLPVWYWSLVGTWKSATRYGEECGDKFNWGIVVKCTLILGIIHSILYFMGVII